MKKKIITAIVLMLLGIGFILLGIFRRPFMPSDNVDSFTDETVGKTVSLCVNEGDIFPLSKYSDTMGRFYYDNQKGVYSSDSGLIVCIYVPDALSSEIDLRNLYESNVTLTGTVKKTSDEIRKETGDDLAAYYKWLSGQIEEYEFTEEEANGIRESISDYCIEVAGTDIAVMKLIGVIAYSLGALLLLISLIMLVSTISRRSAAKTTLVFIAILLVLAAVAGALFHKQILIMTRIRKEASGVYYMEYKEDLRLDDLLAAGITSDEKLFDWISKTEYCGLSPIKVDTGRYGCSSFCAKTEGGDILFGRNFDFPETDTVMVYSKPANGYASYGMVDLAVIGVGRGMNEIEPDNPLGRFMMTAAPYLVMDGVNEKGLGVSVLELADIELHQDSGKPDLFVYTAIRVMLDRCADVDEAVDLLGKYDVHAREGAGAHLFVADRSGRSVVIEWFDDKMYVNELNAVTNSVLTPGNYYGMGSDFRLGVLNDKLTANGGILTAEEARDLLSAVKQGNTEWSAVYNLSIFSADVYMDEHYSHAYHYGYR